MVGFPKRQIGRTGLMVTELGLGCATLGGSRIDVARQTAEEIVAAAWDAGVRYVDTAPFYGVGQAERASATRCATGRATTGCSRPRSAGSCARTRPACIPTAAVIRCRSTRSTTIRMTGSCARSRTACSGSGWRGSTSFMSHDIGTYQHGTEAHPALMRTLRESGYRALEELRGGGAVRAIGIGVNEREVLLEAMEWGQWDAFLLAGRYTLLEQAPLDDLLPRCVAAGTSIVVGGPLNSGILAGRETWNYNPAPPEIVARVKAIAAICDAQPCRCRRRVAVSAGPSGGCRDHPGSAQRRGIPRQSRPAAPPDPGGAVGRSAAGRVAPPGRAGAGVSEAL